MKQFDKIIIGVVGICTVSIGLWSLKIAPVIMNENHIAYISSTQDQLGKIIAFDIKTQEQQQLYTKNIFANKIEANEKSIYFLGIKNPHKHKDSLPSSVQRIFKYNKETGNISDISLKGALNIMIYPSETGIIAELYKDEKEGVFQYNEIQNKWEEIILPTHITHIKQIANSQNFIGISKEHNYKHILISPQRVEQIIGHYHDVFETNTEVNALVLSKAIDEFATQQNLVIIDQNGQEEVEILQDIYNVFWLNNYTLLIHTGDEDTHQITQYNRKNKELSNTIEIEAGSYISSQLLRDNKIALAKLKENQFITEIYNIDTGELIQKIENATYPTQ